jgi:ubiquinone/menaquinone biosynthesis C-methylase UbiE
MKKEYNQLSKFYDVLHHKKDYKKESEFFISLINKYKKSKGNNLLDVACGTGSHLFYFQDNFAVEGVDSSEDFIKIAKEKNPDIKFDVQDMRKLDVKKKFDVITLLFSSIAYLKNKNEIIKTLKNFYKYLEVGGVLIIETIYLKDSLKEIKNHIREYSTNSFSIKRIIDISIEKNIADLKAQYFITEDNKEKNVKDNLEIPLLSKKWLVETLESLNFNVNISKYDKTGTIIFICVKDN